jgi:hypothetical protein
MECLNPRPPAGRGQARARPRSQTRSGPRARLALRRVLDHAHLDGALTLADELPGFGARSRGALHAGSIGNHGAALKYRPAPAAVVIGWARSRQRAANERYAAASTTTPSCDGVDSASPPSATAVARRPLYMTSPTIAAVTINTTNRVHVFTTWPVSGGATSTSQ